MPRETPREPADLVRAFLAAMEARDLATARSFLGEGFAMTFPGGVRMTTLEELVAFAAPRYRFVRKGYEGFEVVGGASPGGARDDFGHKTSPCPSLLGEGQEARAVVYCFGTLSGEWPDGTAFSGIRFIDRFEIANGLLVRQDVWNDLAEIRARAEPSSRDQGGDRDETPSPRHSGLASRPGMTVDVELRGWKDTPTPPHEGPRA